MNEFLEQFVVESRELVNEAQAGLLALETSPKDADCLDAVFRAFHTLKGGAGIVEFSAMERAVHAAEEVLSEIRSGKSLVTTRVISGCLASLDQVSQWLDSIASRGDLPAAGAEADALVRQFAQVGRVEVVPNLMSETRDVWSRALAARHPSLWAARTALRYVPSTDCFLQGEDPAGRIASLPQLLAQELVPILPWPSLSELDPFSCNLVLMALSGAPVEAVRAYMVGALGEVHILELSGTPDGEEAGAATGDLVRELLGAQLQLLADEQAETLDGRIAAVGRVATNVLCAVSRDDDGRNVTASTAQSLSERSAKPLARLLERFLSVAPDEEAVAAMPSAAARVTEATLRVDVARVDALVRLTGELMTAKNSLAHLSVRAQQQEGRPIVESLNEHVADFERLIDRLQRSVLGLRVLPLRTVLQRLPRVVRDISSALGKPVTLHIDGDHTEADKAIVDMLFEPLLHALRNAVDHGVETPARRLALKKPLVATIRIRARRISDRVIVEVEDDGGGIDLDRVRDIAVSRKIVSVEAMENMSEAQIAELIFSPGFSTAQAVSEISGRGVGLDAIRTTVQRVGGQVTLANCSGQGMTLIFSMPFSVMITQVLTVEAGGQTFGIPLDALLETVRVPREVVSGLGAARVMVHRDRTLPLIDLASELGRGAGTDSRELPEVTAALASVSNEIIALRVDRVGERMEVILKPLEGLLTGLKGITGTTVLGDGRVLLVLDLWSLLA